KLYPRCRRPTPLSEELDRRNRALRAGADSLRAAGCARTRSPDVYISLDETLDFSATSSSSGPKDKFSDRKLPQCATCYQNYMDGGRELEAAAGERIRSEEPGRLSLADWHLPCLPAEPGVPDRGSPRASASPDFRGEDQAGQLEIELRPADFGGGARHWAKNSLSLMTSSGKPLTSSGSSLNEGHDLSPSTYAAYYCQYSSTWRTSFTRTPEASKAVNPQFKFEKKYTFKPVTKQLMDYCRTPTSLSNCWGRQKDSGKNALQPAGAAAASAEAKNLKSEWTRWTRFLSATAASSARPCGQQRRQRRRGCCWRERKSGSSATKAEEKRSEAMGKSTSAACSIHLTLHPNQSPHSTLGRRHPLNLHVLSEFTLNSVAEPCSPLGQLVQLANHVANSNHRAGDSATRRTNRLPLLLAVAVDNDGHAEQADGAGDDESSATTQPHARAGRMLVRLSGAQSRRRRRPGAGGLLASGIGGHRSGWAAGDLGGDSHRPGTAGIFTASRCRAQQSQRGQLQSVPIDPGRLQHHGQRRGRGRSRDGRVPQQQAKAAAPSCPSPMSACRSTREPRPPRESLRPRSSGRWPRASASSAKAASSPARPAEVVTVGEGVAGVDADAQPAVGVRRCWQTAADGGQNVAELGSSGFDSHRRWLRTNSARLSAPIARALAKARCRPPATETWAPRSSRSGCSFRCIGGCGDAAVAACCFLLSGFFLVWNSLLLCVCFYLALGSAGSCRRLLLCFSESTAVAEAEAGLLLLRLRGAIR
uniref:C2 domain-containing protein n=1 Tax=Macrostomum lignano TaxID=282301 RepID=A0A1I8F598_9PLAT